MKWQRCTVLYHDVSWLLSLHISSYLDEQTALSESGQSKALIVLDAETWEEKELVPLHIGRRFFRVKGEEEPLPEVGEVGGNSCGCAGGAQLRLMMSS